MDYSIIIRTLGNAEKKYERLLESINKLEPPPKEVIVVIPEGYSLPKEKLGYETFYFSPKGMVKQRLYGIQKCKTQYALICDDDITFSSDFVVKLHEPIKKGICNISAGPLLSFLPKRGFESLFHALTGAAIPKLFDDGKYISVLPTSGYSYNRNIDTDSRNYYEAESLPWTCFYADIDALKKIKMEDEYWLDEHGYAAMDDLTMFYKAKILGIKTMVVSDAIYQHLDARTSRNREEVKKQVAFCLEYNRYIFWHRFIYSQDKGLKKFIDMLCFGYYYLAKEFYFVLQRVRGNLSEDGYDEKHNAIRQAKMYLKSEEYKRLPKV